jgi:hypothetical protein
LKIPNGYSEVVNRRTDSTMAKRLKIPNGYSEVVNHRRTDNTMHGRKKKMKKDYDCAWWRNVLIFKNKNILYAILLK